MLTLIHLPAAATTASLIVHRFFLACVVAIMDCAELEGMFEVEESLDKLFAKSIYI